VTSGRIVVLLTSPRVAPGQLTWHAWQALRDAALVGCASADSPAVTALAAAGVEPVAVEGDDARRWSWLRAAAAGTAESAAAANGTATVVWFSGEDGDPGLLRLISDQLVREPGGDLEVEILHGSYDVPGARLIDLVRVMDRLRTGCPWDREQTHRTLATYLLEETYETLEAIETGDRDHLREELGDLLLQVMFHSRIAEEHESEAWSVDDVAGDIVDKLVRRHPHVFADVHAPDAAAVEANWDTIKSAEKSRTSVLEGIPHALPALALADKVLGRSAKLRPSSGPSAPASRASSGLSDHAEGTSGTPSAQSLSPSEQIGAELLDLVRRARERGVDAEQALRDAIRDLADRIRATESR